MMKIRLIAAYMATAVLVAAPGSAVYAETLDNPSEVLPEAQVHNGVEYRAGGVGLDEREALRAVMHDYTLWLSFTRKGSSAYAADTEVTIRDARGQVVLTALADGPWLLVKLPPGQYRVSALNAGGDAVTQRVTVRDRGITRQVMHVAEAARG